MADTNIQFINPSAANQDNDATYAGDAMRVNGATTGRCPSTTYNKETYQLSMIAAGLAFMMAAKGYTISDGTAPYVAASAPAGGTPQAAIIAALSNILTNADIASILSGYLPQMARAWAGFGWNGASLVINASYNVASITRVSTGVYTVTFTTEMSSAHYMIGISELIYGIGSSSQYGGTLYDVSNGGSAPTASSFQIVSVRSETATDIPRCDFVIFSN